MASEFLRKNENAIRLGRAIELAFEKVRSAMRSSPTRAEIEAERLATAEDDLEQFSKEAIYRWYCISRQNPKPVVEELFNRLNTLGNYSSEPWLRDQMRPILAIVGILRRMCDTPKWSGRPKGKRSKVTPEKIERIRAWLAVRKTASRCSITALAKELDLSRQTVYVVMKEIKK